MADIVIRGMEMPLRCINCPFKTYYHAENRCLANKGKKIEFAIGLDRGTNCPLVPLPEGHGRLVDAREVLEKADKASWFDGDVSELGLLLGSEVTTIVPSEGGGEEG